MVAVKIRHVLRQYLFIYNDSRLEKACNEVLSKTDDHLEKNYKVELFKIYRKFENPLMERIHKEIAQGNWSDIFFPDYLKTLDKETQDLLAV